MTDRLDSTRATAFAAAYAYRFSYRAWRFS
jgi:hypothetical protein